jgi:hypothetical protein
MYAESPSGSVPRLHEMSVVPVHDPCVGVAETNVTPAGSESVAWTLQLQLFIGLSGTLRRPPRSVLGA